MSLAAALALQKLEEAKRVAYELRDLANSCKIQCLRDDGNTIVQEAHYILSQIEERAQTPEGIIPDVLAKAASKAHAAIARVQGRLATANREYKGGFFGNIKAQLDTSHKKSFREAREQLAAALKSLDSVAEVPANDTDAADQASAAAQQQQLQLQLPESDTQLQLKWDRSTHVTGLGLIPVPLRGARPDLWVGLNKQTEMYLACEMSKKTKVPVERKGQAVTCVSFNAVTSQIWTGHSDGTIMLHANQQWEAASYPPQVCVPVRSLAIDGRHNCWAGDDAGIIRVVNIDPCTQRLALRYQDVPPASLHIWQLASQRGAAAAGAAVTAAVSNSGGSSLVAPVLALVGRGSIVLSSGGHHCNYITLWKSQKFEPVERCSTETYGAAHCFAVLDWQEPLMDSPAGLTAAAVASMETGGSGPFGAGVAAGPAPGRAPSGSGRSDSGGSRGSNPSNTGRSGAVAVVAPVQAVPERELLGWRLASGHDRGQVLLWRVAALNQQPGVRMLQLLSVIGEPRQGSPVRAICCFPDFDMMVMADGSGTLTIVPAPTEANGAVASTAGPGGQGVALPMRPSTGTPVHIWSPRFARIKAHKNGINAAVHQGELLVTASNATVKSWTADRLKLEAQGDGLLFSRKSRRSSALSSDGSVLSAGVSQLQQPAAAAAKSAAAGPSRPSQDDVQVSYSSAGRSSRTAGGAAPPSATTASGVASAATVPSASSDTSGSFTAAARWPSGCSEGDSKGLAQQQQQMSAESAVTEPSLLGAASAGSGSQGSGSLQQGPTATGRLLLSCSQPNPFSVAAVKARGHTVDSSNRVVMNQPSGLTWTPPAMPPLSLMPQAHGPFLVSSPFSTAQADNATALASAGNGAGAAGVAGPSAGGVDQAPSLVETGSVKAPNAIRSEHVICASELVLKEVIGAGAEGKVYRGMWTNIDIAAKEYLAVDDAEASGLGANGTPSDAAVARARDALIKEVGLLTSLNHPNLVRFCGVCLDPPLVVMEFYKLGSVYAMLDKARHAMSIAQQPTRPNKYVTYFSWERRLEMLHDVASGMMYLHNRRYVHGDLRSPNLFVGADGRVKIGDFGFTKRLSRSKATLKVRRITHPRWVAPELMTENRLSVSSDVYSFGIIMYELLTWKIPFHECGKEQVVLKVITGQRPTVPENKELPPGTSSSPCLRNYIALMQECWAQEAHKRPSFSIIARRLKAMQRWGVAFTKHQKLCSTLMALQQGSKYSSSSSRPSGSSEQAAKHGSTKAGSSTGLVPAPAAAAAAAAVGRAAAVRSSTTHAGGDGRSEPGAAAAPVAAAAATVPPQLGSPVHSLATDSSLPLPQRAPSVQPSEGSAALDDEPLPVVDMDDLAVHKNPLVDAPPSIQAGKVGDTPFVCIGLPRGAQTGEQQVLAEVQSMALEGGGAAAEQAQFLLVDSDLPNTPYSSNTDHTLPTQMSTGSGTTAGLQHGFVGGPLASGSIPEELLLPATQVGLTDAGGSQLNAAAAAGASNSSLKPDELQSEPHQQRQLPVDAGTAAAAPAGASKVASSSYAVLSLPTIQEAAEVLSTSTSAASRQLAPHQSSTSHGSIALQPSRTASGEVVASHSGASAAVAAAAGGVAARSGGLHNLPPIKVSAERVVHQQPEQQQQQPAPYRPATAENLDAHVKAAAVDAKHKVQDWLQAGPDSSDLAPEAQQRQQLQQQASAVRAAAVPADSPGQLAAAAPGGFMDRPATVTTAEADGTQQDVFTAQDSPFCLLLPGCLSSGSVEMPAAFRPAAAGQATAAGPATPGHIGGAVPEGIASMPSLMDPGYLDDSCLPASDDSQPLLVEAATICYPENRTPAEAAASSVASLRSCSFGSSAAPTLWSLAQPNSHSSGSGGLRLRGQPASNDSQPWSFTAVERSPFAHLSTVADDEPQDALPGAPDGVPCAAGASQSPLPQVDSSLASVGPFGAVGTAAGQPGLREADSTVASMGPFGAAGATRGEQKPLRQVDSALASAGPFGFAAAAAADDDDDEAPLQPVDSALASVGPFGQVMAGGTGAAAAGTAPAAPVGGGPLAPVDSAVASAGPFGAFAGGAAGAGQLDDDDDQPAPPIGPGLPGLEQQQQQQQAAAGPGPGMRASPPASVSPTHAAGAAAAGFGQVPPASPRYPAAHARLGSSPRHASPGPPHAAPAMAADEGARGWLSAVGVVPTAPGASESQRRLSTSSKGSAATGGGGLGGSTGQPSLPDSLTGAIATAAEAAGPAAAGGGGGGSTAPGGPAATAAAAAAQAGAAGTYRALDESVLNKNLGTAIGRTTTTDMSEQGDIDVVDEAQRELEAWQSRDRHGKAIRRSSSNNSSSNPAPSAPPAPAGVVGARLIPPGMSPAQQPQMYGWVPGMAPADGLRPVGPFADGPAGPGMPGPLMPGGPGWPGDAGFMGAGVAVQGRRPSGADAASLQGWMGGLSSSPNAAPQRGSSLPTGTYDPSAVNRVTVLNPSAPNMPLYLQQQQQMQAAAAVAGGAAAWAASVRNAPPYAQGPVTGPQATVVRSHPIMGLFPDQPASPSYPLGATAQTIFTPDVNAACVAMLGDVSGRLGAPDGMQGPAGAAWSHACLGSADVPALPQAGLAQQQQQQRHMQQQPQQAYQQQQQQQHMYTQYQQRGGMM